MSAPIDNNITPVFGTKDDDSLDGGSGSEVFSGLQDNDIIKAKSGSDIVYGGSGDDELHGDQGDDVIYGGGGPCYINLGNLTINEDYQGKLTFLNEGAGYRNSLGIYKINEDGSIRDVEILFANASKAGSGGSLIPGESFVDVPLSAGDQIGFFIVSNGYSHSATTLTREDGHFELRNQNGEAGNIKTDDALTLVHIADNSAETMVNSQYGNDLFHSAASAENNYAPNPDNFAHTVGRMNPVTGEITLGFEDLKYGGDKDYDDTVFKFEIGSDNAQNLITPGAPASPGSEDDTIEGGSGHDEIYGMAGMDEIKGDSGDDKIWGNSGDDTIDGGSGDDIIHGGKNDDTIDGKSGNDELYGNSGDDIIGGGSGHDTIKGGKGNDTIDGDKGNDELYGNSGDDIIDGGSGHDTIKGGKGNDTIDGDKGADTLYGNSGDDTLNDGSGNDFIYAGSGNDTIIASSGNDMIDGGSGIDTIDFSDQENRGANVDLHKHKAYGAGADTLKSIENIIGTKIDDKLLGDKRANDIEGGQGDDFIRGRGGDDILTGGEGEDTFYWRTKDVVRDSSEFVDTVTDFSLDDVLDLSDMFDFDDEENVDIGDWVRLENIDGGQKLEVDLDGAGQAKGWVTIAKLMTNEELDIEELHDDNNLLI